MTDMVMTSLLCVAPDALKRAQRLSFAVSLLQSNIPPREVRKRVSMRWGCSYWTASRTVEMARDIA